MIPAALSFQALILSFPLQGSAATSGCTCSVAAQQPVLGCGPPPGGARANALALRPAHHLMVCTSATAHTFATSSRHAALPSALTAAVQHRSRHLPCHLIFQMYRVHKRLLSELGAFGSNPTIGAAAAVDGASGRKGVERAQRGRQVGRALLRQLLDQLIEAQLPVTARPMLQRRSSTASQLFTIACVLVP